MARNKTAKNLLTSRDTYNRYYGDFRGADFSSDHTQVDERRLAWAVNMYRDYSAGGGKALETVPGFRKRLSSKQGGEINGIHEYRYRGDAPEKTAAITLPEASSFRYRGYVTIESELITGNETEAEIKCTGLTRYIEGLGQDDIDADFTISYIEEGFAEGYILTGFTATKPGTVWTAHFKIGDGTASAEVTTDEKHVYRYTAPLPDSTEVYEYLRTEDAEGREISSEYQSYNKTVKITSTADIAGKTCYAVYREEKYAVYREVLLHIGHELKRWGSFPDDVGLTHTEIITLPAGDEYGTYTVYPEKRSYAEGYTIESVTAESGADITVTATANRYYLTSDAVREEDTVRVTFTDTRGERRTEYAYLTRDGKLTPDHNPVKILKVTATSGETTRDITESVTYHRESITLVSTEIAEGETVTLRYKTESGPDTIHEAFLANAPSKSFMMNNSLYILDGRGYYRYRKGYEFTTAAFDAYVPTTYINTIPSGVNADIGTEYQQRNLLSPYYRQTFIADGETTEFYLNEPAERIDSIKLYGEDVYAYTFDAVKNAVIFEDAPPKPEDAEQPEGHAGIEITAYAPMSENFCGTGVSAAKLISTCTVAAVYDGRIFLAGSPDAPQFIFYCERNEQGEADPSYFGVLNYMQDGTGHARITAMIPIADTLAVLKEKSAQDGTVFYHTPTETGNDIQPKIYPSTQGLAGTGCLGPAANFLDDPVFLSEGGMEAIGQLSVRYERAIEHRSSLIDAKLLQADLAHAIMTEWNGYLCIYEGGKMFLADSRQRYTDEYGNAQYEWYYLEDIGAWRGQYTLYKYAERVPAGLEGKTVRYCTACRRGAGECTCESESAWIEIPLCAAESVYNADLDETLDLRREAANPADEDGNETREIFRTMAEYDGAITSYPVEVHFTVHDVRDRETLEHVRYEAYLCGTQGEQTGGTFRPATVLKVLDGVLYFGTGDGEIFCFNTDKRDENGEIPPEYYDFDGRAIYAGCATKMDNCGIPHLTKSTVKRSTVIKTKTFADSAAKIKVRTNKKPYEQIARINSRRFVADSVDFSDFSFATGDQSLFSIKEKEKKWVEKQYYIYTDEYRKPFALYYVCYRYTVAGRFKD